MTAALGVNDDEIGVVVKRALDTPYVGGVSIQPRVRLRALAPASTRCDRLTHTGVLARLEEQTGGLVTWRDLTALPCSHPHCCSRRLPAARRLAATWRSLVALIGHDRLKQWLDLEPDVLANRIADARSPRSCADVVKELAARPAQRAVVAVAPVDRRRSGATSARTATSASARSSRLAGDALPGQHERLRAMLGERVCASPSSRSWT